MVLGSVQHGPTSDFAIGGYQPLHFLNKVEPRGLAQFFSYRPVLS
jgi:hypothetical protein